MNLEELDLFTGIVTADQPAYIHNHFNRAYNAIKRSLESGENPDPYFVEMLNKVVVWVSLRAVRDLKVTFTALAETSKGISLFYPGKTVLVTFDYDALKQGKVVLSVEEVRYPILLHLLPRPAIVVRDGVLLAWETNLHTD